MWATATTFYTPHQITIKLASVVGLRTAFSKTGYCKVRDALVRVTYKSHLTAIEHLCLKAKVLNLGKISWAFAGGGKTGI